MYGETCIFQYFELYVFYVNFKFNFSTFNVVHSVLGLRISLNILIQTLKKCMCILIFNSIYNTELNYESLMVEKKVDGIYCLFSGIYAHGKF